MSLKISTQQDFDGLAAALEALAGWRNRTGPAGPRSDWSGDEHLYHIALATDLALSNVAALVEGQSGRIVESAAPNELALRVLAEGSYPRGESKAPRTVHPPDEIDQQLLAEEFEALEALLEKVRRLGNQLSEASGAIVHRQLGALSAEQWLRFAHLHAIHHLAIVEDIARD